MEPIVWTDELSVGIVLFDEQHKRLVRMLNRMIADPSATTRSETISDILTELTRYAQEHFKCEEDWMIQHNYPRLEEHREKHMDFRKTVAELCVATSSGLDSVPKILLEYLKNWLTQHILHEDMMFKPFNETLQSKQTTG
ncbi:MAG: bacteriohemerythrin [Proteobacteria bacterium]|nr:bacteriohemerythrin [Pseudomonadota bacterium]